MNLGARTAMWTNKGGGMETHTITEDANYGINVFAYFSALGRPNTVFVLKADSKVQPNKAIVMQTGSNGNAVLGVCTKNVYGTINNMGASAQSTGFISRGDVYYVIPVDLSST